MFELAFCFCVSTEVKRWPEQILRLGTALLPDARGEGQKESKMKKMKKGDIVVVDDERYVVSKLSVLGAELTHLDGNDEPIKDQSIWKPRNELCEKLIDCTDWIDDFAGRYFFPISVIGVLLSIIDLASSRQTVVLDLLILTGCGSLFVIWLFKLISEGLIRLSVKLSERKKLHRKKELEE